MITYRASTMPIKKAKRILLDHFGSENYINEMSDDEIRSCARTIQMQETYKEILDSMRSQNFSRQN